jgi:pyridoxamine 5'-phosphate oxidase
MIKFLNESVSEPFIIFKKKYLEALKSNQKSIEAICVSSFSKENNEVDSRFVNLKFIDHESLIFFTNYNSIKAKNFKSHKQASIAIYWNSINIQFRFKGKIKKAKKNFNIDYFKNRSKHKNALAISSSQSKIIDSYDSVLKKYQQSLQSSNLRDCPNYWGGYIFQPYYLEIWEGHESRINKRVAYKSSEGEWNNFFLEP